MAEGNWIQRFNDLANNNNNNNNFESKQTLVRRGSLTKDEGLAFRTPSSRRSLTKASDRFWFEMPDEDSDEEFVCRPLKSPLPTVKQECEESGLSEEPQTLGLQTNLAQPGTRLTRLNLDDDQEPPKSSKVSPIPENKSAVTFRGAGTIKRCKTKRNTANAGERVCLESGDVDRSIITPSLRNPSVGNTDRTRIPHENKREVPSPEDTSVTESTDVQVCPVTEKSTVPPEPKQQSGITLQRRKSSATKAGDRFWFEMPDDESDEEIYFGQLCKH